MKTKTKKKPNRRDLTERNLGPIKKLEREVRQLKHELTQLEIFCQHQSVNFFQEYARIQARLDELTPRSKKKIK